MMPSRVLVADDDPTILEFLVMFLTDEGHSVRAASDGLHALQHLEHWRPDLILLDLQMPRLDGRGVLAALHADSRLAEIPVVLMSATVTPPPELLPQIAAFLAKPFRLDDVLELVASVASTARPEMVAS